MARTRKLYSKDTWDLMSSISKMIKPDPSNEKFKWKKGYSKKNIKRIKRECPHWYINKKNHAVSALMVDNEREGYAVCRICGAKFPTSILSYGEYIARTRAFLEIVNQIEFWDVEATGGHKSSMNTYMALRHYIPRFLKSAKNIGKVVNKKNKTEATIEARKNSRPFRMHAGTWNEV